jgi:ABC-type uncharacterized transport system ATPase subunit
VDEVRREHSLPEVRVHAAGPIPAVREISGVVEESEGTWRLMLSDHTSPSEALAALVRAGARIDRFEPMLAPMEDIFLRVVREEAA